MFTALSLFNLHRPWSKFGITSGVFPQWRYQKVGVKFQINGNGKKWWVKASQSESSRWGKRSTQKIPWTEVNRHSREGVIISLLHNWDTTASGLVLPEGTTASIHTLRLHTLLRNSTGLTNSSTSRNKLLRMKPLLTRVDWTLPTPPNPRCAFVQISLTEQLDSQWLHGQFLTAEETSHQFSSHFPLMRLKWQFVWSLSVRLRKSNRYVLLSLLWVLGGQDPQCHGRDKGKWKWKGQSVLILNYSTLCCWCNPSKPAISSWPLFYEQSCSNFDNKRNTGG